jgi:hypothetical protein
MACEDRRRDGVSEFDQPNGENRPPRHNFIHNAHIKDAGRREDEVALSEPPPCPDAGIPQSLEHVQTF